MLKTSRIAKLWPVLLSGLLYALAFSPFNLFLLVFVALVPWLIALKDSERPFRSGLLFGLIFWLAQGSWVVLLVMKWTGSLLLGIVPLLLIIGLGIWYFGVLGWAIHRAFSMNRIWLIPIIWAGMEMIRARAGILAFPWGFISTPLASQPALIQSAALGQVFFVSAWVVLANMILVQIAQGEKPRLVLRYAMVFFGVLFLSVARYMSPPAGQMKVLAAGQPGTDMAFGGEESRRKLFQILPIQYQRAMIAKADLVVFPEALIQNQTTLPPIHPFGALSPRTPVVFGGTRETGGRPMQSAYTSAPTWAVTDKTQLVAFGEYVPFRRYLPFVEKFNLPLGDFQPGIQIQNLKAGDLVVGPSICFEALFPHIATEQANQGANVLAVLSIDDWFLGSHAPEQLQQSAVFRAVENGLPLVRSATMGRSMILDARGNLLRRAEYGQSDVIRTRVSVPDKSDAMPGREWFGWLAVLAGVLGLIKRR